MQLSASIFKAYDIRGVLGVSLDDSVAYQIGQAFGSASVMAGESAVVVGYDGRLSGPSLAAALAAGLQSTGVDVIDIGMVPTPVLVKKAGMPAPPARSFSASVPWGVNSKASSPARYWRSNSLFSPT